jgi:hypothetical protein
MVGLYRLDHSGTKASEQSIIFMYIKLFIEVRSKAKYDRKSAMQISDACDGGT